MYYVSRSLWKNPSFGLTVRLRLFCLLHVISIEITNKNYLKLVILSLSFELNWMHKTGFASNRHDRCHNFWLHSLVLGFFSNLWIIKCTITWIILMWNNEAIDFKVPTKNVKTTHANESKSICKNEAAGTNRFEDIEEPFLRAFSFLVSFLSLTVSRFWWLA